MIKLFIPCYLSLLASLALSTSATSLFQSSPPVFTPPQVNKYGYSYQKMWYEDVGIDAGVGADLTASYQIPYLSENQYVGWAPSSDLLAGSTDWVSFYLYFMRIHLWIEVSGLKLTPYLKLLFDVIAYNDLCLDIGYTVSALEINLYSQVDFLDCNMGVLGFVGYFIEKSGGDLGQY